MTPSAPAWLGLDLGTSSCKAVLAGADGTTLARGRAPVILEEPEPLAAEQDAHAWWSAALGAIRACLDACPGTRVAGVGLTGQKHALLVLDERKEPLGKAVLWCDGRAASHLADVEQAVEGFARRTGAPPLAGYVVPKWLRWKALRPEAARRARHLCFAKDWLRLCLTGVLATDRTEASSSQLWDAREGTWSAELATAFGLPPGSLPEVLPSTASSGRVHAAAAAATGLAEGTPVVAGAGDNEASALACGAIEDGIVAVVLGTSGTVVAPADRRGRVGGLVWGESVLRRGLFATGTLLSAGRALAWFAEVAFSGDVAALLEAAGCVEGDVPVFLPTLAGERSPVPDALAAGAFAGLRPHHGRSALARAVVEGVACSLGQIVEALRADGIAVDELRLLGQGAASRTMRRLVAAASRAPSRPAGAREAPARGAALLAAAQGTSDSELIARARAWARPGEPEVPAEQDVARLGRASAALTRLRQALRNPVRGEAVGNPERLPEGHRP